MINIGTIKENIRRPAIPVAVLLVFASICSKFPFLYYAVIPVSVALFLYFALKGMNRGLVTLLMCVFVFAYPSVHMWVSLSSAENKIPEPDIAGYTLSVDDSIALSDEIIVIGRISKNGSPSFTCAIAIDGKYPLAVGERVRFYGLIERIDKADKIPMNRDFYYSRGCYTFCTPFDYTVLGLGEFEPETLREKYASFVDGVSERYLDSRLADGYMKALLCGDRSGMTKDQRNEFKLTGLAPYLAVSGVHLTTVALFTTALLSVFGSPIRVSAVAAVLACVLFAYVTGEKSSCIRAAAMFALFSAGRLLGEKADAYSSLAASFILVWLINPLYTFDIGTQLSFVATLAVLSGAEASAAFDGRFPSFVIRFILAPVFISLHAVLFTAPFTLACFKGVPMGAVLASVIVQPLFVPIMLLLFLLVVSDFVGFSFICKALSKPALLLLGLFDETVNAFAKNKTGYIPGSHVSGGFISAFAVFYALSLGTYLVFLAKGDKRGAHIAALLVTVVSGAFLAITYFTLLSQ